MIIINDAVGVQKHKDAANPHAIFVPRYATSGEVEDGSNSSTLITPADIKSYLTDNLKSELSADYSISESQAQCIQVGAKVEDGDSNAKYVMITSLDFDFYARNLNHSFYEFTKAEITDHDNPNVSNMYKTSLVGGQITGGSRKLEDGKWDDENLNMMDDFKYNLFRNLASSSPYSSGVWVRATPGDLETDPMVDKNFYFDTFEFLVQIANYKSPLHELAPYYPNKSNLPPRIYMEPGTLYMPNLNEGRPITVTDNPDGEFQSQFGRWTTRLKEMFSFYVSGRYDERTFSEIDVIVHIRNARSQKIVKTLCHHLKIIVR